MSKTTAGPCPGRALQRCHYRQTEEDVSCEPAGVTVQGQPWVIAGPSLGHRWGQPPDSRACRGLRIPSPPSSPQLGRAGLSAAIYLHPLGTNGFLPCLYHRINRDFPDQRLSQAWRWLPQVFSPLSSCRACGTRARPCPAHVPARTVSTFWKGTDLHTLWGRGPPVGRTHPEPSRQESELTSPPGTGSLCQAG